MSFRSFWRSRSGRDFEVVVALSLLAPASILALNRSPALVRHFHRWLHRVDPLHFLEGTAFFGVTLVLGIVYAYRRWWDLVREIQRRKRAEAEVKVLRGLIHICGFCRMIKDPDGDWCSLEAYLDLHSEARLSHGMCPSCASTYWLQ